MAASRGQALGEIALDILDDDDGVVDDDADGQHQPEQRQRVEGDADGGHDGESADQRHRNGDDRMIAAPRLQKEDDDEDDEQHGLPQRLDDLVDRRLDELRGVVDDPVFDTRGKSF